MATGADLGRSRRRSRFHVLTSVRLVLMEAQSRSSQTEVGTRSASGLFLNKTACTDSGCRQMMKLFNYVAFPAQKKRKIQGEMTK